jgi:hypothetical protein
MTIIEIILVVAGIVLVIFNLFLLKKTQNDKEALEVIANTPVREYSTPIQLETVRAKTIVSRYDMRCINTEDIKTIVRERLASDLVDYIKDKLIIDELYDDEDPWYTKYETTIKVNFGREGREN